MGCRVFNKFHKLWIFIQHHFDCYLFADNNPNIKDTEDTVILGYTYFSPQETVRANLEMIRCQKGSPKAMCSGKRLGVKQNRNQTFRLLASQQAGLSRSPPPRSSTEPRGILASMDGP